MDDIVKQAMAKWPNVPHCYGWLALDARGNWRMRDERAQKLNLAGDRIGNAALAGFINRNYLCDAQGRWYFQNGPQRVYVKLEATPFIARTDPAHGFVLHTGEALKTIDAAWLSDNGLLIFQDGEKVAQIDDRDMAQCLASLHINDEPCDDDRLLAWLADPSDGSLVTFEIDAKHVTVGRIKRIELADKFGFASDPSPEPS